MAVTVALASLIFAFALWLFAWPAWRRRRLLRRPFPPAWLTILRHRLPFHDRMSPVQQEHLQELVTLFLADKRFVGCEGLAIDDDMRLTIAGQACLLLLNRPSRGFAGVGSIYLYPTAFQPLGEFEDETGLVYTHGHELLGESREDGKVVLAWDSVEYDVANFDDGFNVVLHEFAHALDQESGGANGAPLLYSRAAYESWAKTFGREFEALQQADPEADVLLDDYGATDPAEFFAVATETFFEQPHELHEYHRELFEELRSYYRLDPRDWW